MSIFFARVADALRGVAIGVAEVVPGVSGGTIALIVGVYNTLIGSASTLIRAVVGIFSAHRAELWKDVAKLPWMRLFTIVIGMAAAVVVAASYLEPLIEQHPETTRAVFAGLILASLAVPARMAGGIRGVSDLFIIVLAAALTFFLTGLPAQSAESPSLWVVAAAAAVAICALVLPGVSGSFLLVSIGLYQPTIAAVNDRDFAYLGVFAAGAVVGLGSFVVVLQWLLTHRTRITLLVMTGLMVGSLRALWPWQTENRHLLAPGSNWPEMILWVLGGLVVVGSMVLIERRVEHNQAG